MVAQAGGARYSVSGSAAPGFEKVQQTFVENFEQRGELGAACAVYHRGKKVVDLWGGVRDAATGEPWQEDTMAIVYSTTKGMAGVAMALAESRGLFDYEERVSTYWPEFAQNGKESVTVRQLLSHQAGLFALDEPTTAELVADLDRLAVVLARQRPAWEPGERQAYHGITLGFYENELLRRVDPQHRTIGGFFQEEIAGPLGEDFYIRLPTSIPDERLAPMVRPSALAMISVLFTIPFAFAIATMNPRSNIRRCLQGSELPDTEANGRVYARELEIPAGGGVGTARALAHIYGEFATGGKKLGLRGETLKRLMAPPVSPARGFRDECFKLESRLALGFMRPGPDHRFAHPGSFGAPGTGGSFAFADPHNQLGFGYVPNRMVMRVVDLRAEALRQAAYESIGVRDPYGTD